MPPSAAVLVHAIKDVTIVDFNQAVIVDDTQIARIGQQLHDLVDRQARKKIILDFSKTRSLSSSALSILIALRSKADQINGRIVICGLGKELKRAFKITNLHKLFTICKNEETALAKFGVTTAG